MGKTLADVDLQVRQLIGDFQRTNFTPAQVTEAINWAQNAMIRLKGFKRASRLYDLSAYPTGVLPPDWLVIKRVQLVQSALGAPHYTITVTPSSVSPVNFKMSVAVTITRYNGFADPITIFIPINRIGSDGDGVYINSPVAQAATSIGNYVGDVAQGHPGDPGFFYANAADSFIINMNFLTGATYPNISLLGTSTIAPQQSNVFSIL